LSRSRPTTVGSGATRSSSCRPSPTAAARYCKAGQEVFCPAFGVLGEHTDGAACERLQVPSRLVYPKPPALTWEEAAAFPLTFLTAYRMLTTRAHLQAGETLLVVGAGAGVGVAAIVIGRHLGAKVYATSRSEAKQERARQLGAGEAFATDGFSNVVRELTAKQGVDVIFDSVGAATIDEDLKAIRLGGRIVTCGSTSGPKVTILWPRLFFRHADLLGSTMGNASEFEEVLALIDKGVRPVVDSVYPLAEVSEALRHLDAAEQVRQGHPEGPRLTTAAIQIRPVAEGRAALPPRRRPSAGHRGGAGRPPAAADGARLLRFPGGVHLLLRRPDLGAPDRGGARALLLRALPGFGGREDRLPGGPAGPPGFTSARD